jgi:uncharacterized Zn-finger protein
MSKRHQCDTCDKTFVDKSKLQTHIKCVHLRLKKYKCTLCNAAFGQNSNLQRHVKTVHIQEREYTVIVVR